MKPVSQIPQLFKKRTEFDPSTRRRNPASLLVDCHFQDPTLGSARTDAFGGQAVNPCIRPPSLWKTSREFFRTEAPNHFLEEAISFTAIVILSAWPLVILIKALASLIR